MFTVNDNDNMNLIVDLSKMADGIFLQFIYAWNNVLFCLT